MCVDFSGFLVPPVGLEPTTYGLEVRRAVQLRYGGLKTRFGDRGY